MSRRDNPSVQIRGVPRALLDRLDAVARANQRTRNAELLGIIRDYAAYDLTPEGQPPPFDATRARAAPHDPNTAVLSISGIPPDDWKEFRERARSELWLSKDDLIVGLLRKKTEFFS